MVYRVLSEDQVQILSLNDDEPTEWLSDFPFENYPEVFPEIPVIAEPVPDTTIAKINRLIDEDGCAEDCSVGTELLFPRVGGRHEMQQGFPEWRCPTVRCEYGDACTDEGKETFAVIWEIPIPNFNFWTENKVQDYWGECQIIFSRCVGCGVIHSCNRCD